MPWVLSMPARVLDIAGSWIYQGSKYASDSQYASVLNIPGIVGRGLLAFYFRKIPPYILPTPSFFKFHPLPLTKAQTSALFVALFLWLNEWSCHIWSVILLALWYYGSTHVQPWYLSTRRTCCVFYTTRCHSYWSLTQVFFPAILIWYPTHTKKNTQYTKGPIDWHTNRNVY